jgi:predicted RNA-binding protein
LDERVNISNGSLRRLLNEKACWLREKAWRILRAGDSEETQQRRAEGSLG